MTAPAAARPALAGATVTQVYAKLPARDVERAKRFYAKQLELEPYREIGSHVYYEVAGLHFIVFPSSGAPSGTHDQLGFAVDDIEAAVARLKERGVRFESYPPPPGASIRGEITDLGPVKAAWFKDSEGNLISVAEFVNGNPFGR